MSDGGFEGPGTEIGAGVSVIVVDADPGDGSGLRTRALRRPPQTPTR